METGYNGAPELSDIICSSLNDVPGCAVNLFSDPFLSVGFAVYHQQRLKIHLSR